MLNQLNRRIVLGLLPLLLTCSGVTAQDTSEYGACPPTLVPCLQDRLAGLKTKLESAKEDVAKIEAAMAKLNASSSAYDSAPDSALAFGHLMNAISKVLIAAERSYFDLQLQTSTLEEHIDGLMHEQELRVQRAKYGRSCH